MIQQVENYLLGANRSGKLRLDRPAAVMLPARRK